MSNCQFCGTQILQPATLCPQCQTPLPTFAELLPVDPKEVLPAGRLAPDTPYAVPETLQQTLVQQQTQIAEQGRALAQFRLDIQDQLEQHRLALQTHQQEVANQLANKADKTPEPPQPDLAPWQRRVLSISLLVASLFFLANLLLILLYSKSAHRSDALMTLSTAMIIFGGFYLAYDLLGRQDGPLVRITVYLTSALIGVLGASLAIFLLIVQNTTIVSPGTVLQNLNVDPATLASDGGTDLTILTHSALFCVLCGALIGISGGFLVRPYQFARFSWRKALFFDLVYCFGFWAFFFAFFDLTYSSDLGIDANFIGVELLILAPLAVITTFIIRLYRFFIIDKLSDNRTDNSSNMKSSQPKRKTFLPDLLFWSGFWLLPLGIIYISLIIITGNDASLRDSFVPFVLFVIVIIITILLALVSVFTVRFSRLLARLFRFPINLKTRHPWRYWTIFFVSTLLVFSIPPAVPLLVVYFFFDPKHVTLLLLIDLSFALSGTIPAVFAGTILKWINGLSERLLEGVGLALASIGTVLAVSPMVVDLFK